MSAFSECFNRIKDEKNLRCIDMARMCDMDVTVIFRWLNGERLPAGIDKIGKLQYGLRLTEEEKNKLEKAYIISIYGETAYNNFEEIVKVITKMQKSRHRKKEENIIWTTEYNNTDTEISINKDFTVLNEKEKIIKKIVEMIVTSSHMKDKTLRFMAHSMSSELETIFTLHAPNIQGFNIELLYLTKSNEIEGLEQFVDIAFFKNDIQIWLSSETIGTTGMNTMIMGNMLLQYNDEMTEAIYTTYPEWIQMESKTFSCIKGKAKMAGKKELDGLQYVNVTYDDNSTIHVLECQPCIMDFIDENMIRKHIYKDLPMREEMVSKIVNTYLLSNNFSKESTLYFTKEGLDDFMSTGTLMVFPYPVYAPFTLEERCAIVRKCTNLLYENNKQIRLIKDKRLSELRDLHIEYVKNGDEECVRLDVNFEGHQKERMVFNDPFITRKFADFFQCIQNDKYIYSAEKTKQYMISILEKYENQMNGTE